MNKWLPYGLFFVFVLVLATWYFLPKEIFIIHECDITKNQCVVKKENFELSFKISPTPITPREPLNYTISINAPVQFETAHIYLLGHSMEMDNELIQLEKSGPNQFKALRNFPFCTEEKMTWRAHLSLKGDKTLVKSNFDFEVTRE